MYRYLFKILLSTLLGEQPEVELLDHIEILSLIFGGTVILLPTATRPFYIPTNGVQEFQCLRSTLHIRENILDPSPTLSIPSDGQVNTDLQQEYLGNGGQERWSIFLHSSGCRGRGSDSAVGLNPRPPGPLCHLLRAPTAGTIGHRAAKPKYKCAPSSCNIH